MKNTIKKIVSVVLSVCFVLCTAFYSFSLTAGQKNQLNNDINALRSQANQIQKEINALKSQKNNQAAVLDAVRRKIANTQAQINRCNQEINKINTDIAANKAEIDKKNKEIEKDKFEFQKRIRAIYMSNNESNLKILLGAENFSDYLQLSQLTSSVSARDKKMMEDLSAEIDVLNKKNEENKKLMDEQVSIRAGIKAKQDELAAEESEAAAIYNSIANEQKQNQDQKNAIESEIRKKQKQLEDDIRAANYSSFINPATHLMWPINGFRGISAGFQSNDSVHRGHHNGIDISGGGIQGQPIRAIADGVVTLVSNSCSHNYKKSGNCCGNGYGNYCVINHGTMTINGSSANYVAYYAHAQTIIVGNGSRVTQGQVIGYVGTTGWSTGYHLHLGIMRNNAWINPYPLFF